MRQFIIFFFSAMMLNLAVMAQSPKSINYQAVARDLSGNALMNQNITLKISILYGSDVGEMLYSELHNVTTNDLGIFTIGIGEPDNVLYGNFNDIEWGVADHFLKLEMDENGGDDFRLAGITQLLTVPYAINASSLILSDDNGKRYEVKVDTSGNLFAEPVVEQWHCGSPFTDDRDGQAYNTVQIGDSLCWMAQNMNYETGTSYCYQDDPANCDIYGRMYDWFTAMEVCPDGWHLPGDDEFKILEGEVDSQYPVGDPQWNLAGWRGFDAGKNLKTTTGWNNNGNGTDLFGFSALPAGERSPTGSYFMKGSKTKYWTTKDAGSGAGFRLLNNDYDQIYRGNNDKASGFSVRCVKD